MNDKPLLKTPGEMISEAREAQDLSIAQLSERTKIPPPVLSALELDEYHKISGPLYIKSFLRTCASDLGLDPDIVLGLYKKISGEQQGGSGGADMVWDEDKVQVSRIGLPWIQIILVAGIVAVLVGVGLFTLRGCGAEEEAATVENQAEDAEPTPLAAVVDSASGYGPQHESLIPAEKEKELKELAAAVPETRSDQGSSSVPTRDLVADSLSVGWILSPPEPPLEVEKEAKAEEVAVAIGDDDGDGENMPPGESAADVSESPVQEPDDQVAQQASGESPVEVARDIPRNAAGADSSPDEATGTVVIVAAETPSTTVPAEVPRDEQPAAQPVVEDWVDSAWPLVLRVVCDAPQRIQVKRDGDHEFTEVRWPEASAAAPELPAAGFEAGRAYRQGDRLVVFWGADDHFSLILARVRGVEIAVNGRIRDIAKLRAGQELILDSHSAGSSGGR